jgi:hypothetical protein
MPFGVENEPLTFQKTVNKVFKEYLDHFMNIYLDDFIVYSDIESHLMKFFSKMQKIQN